MSQPMQRQKQSASAEAPASSVREVVRFLLARLEDDLALAKRLSRLPEGTRASLPGYASPDRIRADVEAKRNVIGALQQQILLRDQPDEQDVRGQAVRMLLQLTGPYTGHRTYRAQWSRTAEAANKPQRRRATSAPRRPVRPAEVD